MRLEPCWFCSCTVYPGHGITFVRNDATAFRFCSSKCHKSFKMKRLPRKKRWTKTHRKLSGKELADDTTFQMERRRNRPERYNRELVHTTIKAMKTITEIRKKRQDRFYDLRMRKADKYRRAEARRELKRDVRLVRAEDNLLRDEIKEKLKIPVEQTQSTIDEMKID